MNKKRKTQPFAGQLVPNGGPRSTIKDVAAEAGVSVAAVSKVVRDAYGVSDEMRAKVQAAIDKLGYRPNVGARTMRGRSYTVGVKATELSSLFVGEVVEAISDELDGTPFDMIMTATGPDRTRQKRSIEALLDRRIDGLIVIAPWVSPAWLEQVAARVPTVVVAQHGLTKGYDTVVNDDAEGARMVVDHLVGLGHRRIAHTSQPVGTDSAHPLSHVARQRGYEDAMRDHGLEPDVIVTSYSEHGGYEAAREALARPERPTAIFAGMDIAALGAMRAIEDAGLSVPGDISLVGYDNIWISAIKRISLTTVDQSSRVTGAASARLLLERMKGDRSQPVRYTVAPSLIVRGTSAPPPQTV